MRDKTMARIRNLESSMEELTRQFIELRKELGPGAIKQMAIEALQEDRAGMQKLADEAARILNLLCQQGMVDRSELNSAIANRNSPI